MNTFIEIPKGVKVFGKPCCKCGSRKPSVSCESKTGEKTYYCRKCADIEMV